MTMAVDDMATAPPITTATAGATSRNRVRPAATMPVVTSTCAPPTPSTSQRIATRRGRENSNPSVNTRNTTPKSANSWVVAPPVRQVEGVRTQQHPHREISENGRQFQFAHARDHAHGSGEQNQDL